MLLTQKELEKYLVSRRISIPADLQQDLLEQYGNTTLDDEGVVREHTEQDIFEQLRKTLRKDENQQEREIDFNLI